MKRIVSVLALLAIALPALAQDATDWSILRDARKKTVVAFTDFDSGISIAVRCVDKSYEAIIGGLPEIRGETRRLTLRFPNEDHDHEETWNVATNSSIAVSSFPALFARELREGGTLNLVVPQGAADGRNLRYVITLPPSPSAIDETLTACSRPLVDPRDAEVVDIGEGGLPDGINWAQRPRPRYPNTNYARGFAVITCLSNPDGSVKDCVVESEHPQEAGFGAAALRGARDARLQSTTGNTGSIRSRLISFRTNFYMAGYEPRRAPGRAPSGE
jgi:hypothetical protein